MGTGSSYFASIAEKYLFEEMTGLPVFSSITSLLNNYTPLFLDSRSIVFFHSHSGMTGGDDGAVEFARSRGAYTIGVTDIPGSDLAEAVDDAFIGPGGRKVELPATRTYSTALFRMYMLSFELARKLGNVEIAKRYETVFKGYPEKVKDFIDSYEKVAPFNVEKLKDCESFIHIGYGPNLATAEEGALAFSQCASVPAQSFEMENFIHGLMQTLSKKMGVVIIANEGMLQSRILKIARAVKIIGAKVILLIDDKTDMDIGADIVIKMPAGIPELISPVIYMIPLWQTAYYFHRLERGSHPDRLFMDRPEFKKAFSYIVSKEEKWISSE
jgi:glucosamine 6-phosphate synthetase-like amidotransferase/phosphosugar isomerase protein